MSLTQLAAAADTFSMLASPARLHLVQLMSTGRYDVGELAERVGLSLPTPQQSTQRQHTAPPRHNDAVDESHARHHLAPPS